MIALFLALQISVASSSASVPTFIVVRDGSGTTSVPVTINGGEPSVRADALMRAMKGTLITGTNLHYTLALPRVRLDLIDGIPFAKRDTLTIPLTRAPQVRGGQLYLPFQFVSEVLPRYGGYAYDVAQAELPVAAPMTVSSTSTRVAPNSTAVATRPVAVAAESSRSPALPAPARTSTAHPPQPRKLVVIDAGHGGPDNGMQGPIGNPT